MIYTEGPQSEKFLIISFNTLSFGLCKSRRIKSGEGGRAAGEGLHWLTRIHWSCYGRPLATVYERRSLHAAIHKREYDRIPFTSAEYRGEILRPLDVFCVSGNVSVDIQSFR